MLDNITIYNGLMQRVIQTLDANRIAIKEIKCINEERNNSNQTITLTFKAIDVDGKTCTALATASEKDYTYSIDFRGID